MSKKDKQINEMSDVVMLIGYIACDNNNCTNYCEAHNIMDEEDAAKDFHKSGWRIIDGLTYCKKCFKKISKK